MSSGCRTLSLAKIDAKWKALITKCHVLLDCCVQALSIADVEIGEVILRCVLVEQKTLKEGRLEPK